VPGSARRQTISAGRLRAHAQTSALAKAEKVDVLIYETAKLRLGVKEQAVTRVQDAVSLALDQNRYFLLDNA
jgi:hypothetical protein